MTTTDTITFSTDAAGLEQCLPSREVEIGDGESFDLRIAAVAKTVGDDVLRMLSYNGSIPGPRIWSSSPGSSRPGRARGKVVVTFETSPASTDSEGALLTP